jgi:type IV pilus assembly protein PilV
MRFVYASIRKKESGMTLLEALIALVVLSVGLLGMAGLQLTSMKMTNNSYYRSQATWLAYDILDRMRANFEQAANSNRYKIGLKETTSTTVNCAGTAADCNPAEMAQYDLHYWKTTLAAVLPAGDGEIFFEDTADGRTYTVAVQWDDSHSSREDYEQRLKRFQLRTGL